MYRRVTRRVKSDQEIMDEMVETMLMRMTPKDMERELADRLYVWLENLPEDEFFEERERLEVSIFEDPQDWEDRDEIPE